MIIIPSSSLELLYSKTSCPYSLLKRDFFNELNETASSFSSWDRCQENKACHIISIVGIVLACLIVVWILGSLIRCLCCGVTFVGSLCCLCAACCSCCPSGDRRRKDSGWGRQSKKYQNMRDSPYDNAGPPVPSQPIQSTYRGYEPAREPSLYAADASLAASERLKNNNFTTAYEVFNPDGTISVTTEPPPVANPPSQTYNPSNQTGFGMRSGNTGYQPLDGPYNNELSSTTYVPHNEIEMTSYPMGSYNYNNSDNHNGELANFNNLNTRSNNPPNHNPSSFADRYYNLDDSASTLNNPPPPYASYRP